MNEKNDLQEIESLLRQILAALQEHNQLLDSFIGAAPDRRTWSWSSCSQAREDLQLLHDTLRLLSKCTGCGSEPPRWPTTIGISHVESRSRRVIE